MKCAKCGTENPNLAKFCVSCGEELEPSVNEFMDVEDKAEEPVSQQEEQVAPQENQVHEGEPVPRAEAQPNEFVEQTKAISKSYWGFVLDALKAPFGATKRVGAEQSDLIHGLITLVIFALFVPLTLYFSSRGVFGGWVRPPFCESVMLPLIMLVILIAVMFGIIFGVALFMRSEIDFMQVYTRFMTLMVIPAGLAILALLFSVLNAYTFSTILISLSLALMMLAGIGAIFSIKETKAKPGGLDVIYVVIIYLDRKSTRLNSSHVAISYAVFCLKKKTQLHNK